MAATTASHERALMRSPNSSTLSSTVQTGIVKARMPARPAGNCDRPMIEHRCQPMMLGSASQARRKA